MLNQNFIAAAKDYGEYCPFRNELRVRRGRKVYRLTCGDAELRVAATGQPEVVLPIADNATVQELKCAFSLIVDSSETSEHRVKIASGQ